MALRLRLSLHRLHASMSAVPFLPPLMPFSKRLQPPSCTHAPSSSCTTPLGASSHSLSCSGGHPLCAHRRALLYRPQLPRPDTQLLLESAPQLCRAYVNCPDCDDCPDFTLVERSWYARLEDLLDRLAGTSLADSSPQHSLIPLSSPASVSWQASGSQRLSRRRLSIRGRNAAITASCARPPHCSSGPRAGAAHRRVTERRTRGAGQRYVSYDPGTPTLGRPDCGDLVPPVAWRRPGAWCGPSRHRARCGRHGLATAGPVSVCSRTTELPRLLGWPRWFICLPRTRHLHHLHHHLHRLRACRWPPIGAISAGDHGQRGRRSSGPAQARVGPPCPLGLKSRCC
jgi:hypothetical protein